MLAVLAGGGNAGVRRSGRLVQVVTHKLKGDNVGKKIFTDEQKREALAKAEHYIPELTEVRND